MESASSCSQIGSVASLELHSENTTPVKDKKKSKKKKVTNNPPFKSREAENQITERAAGKTYFPLAYLAYKIMNTWATQTFLQAAGKLILG